MHVFYCFKIKMHPNTRFGLFCTYYYVDLESCEEITIVVRTRGCDRYLEG